MIENKGKTKIKEVGANQASPHGREKNRGISGGSWL
jgi:hypothetical protein